MLDQAWYIRQPADYALAANSAWEGLVLPFPVNYTTAQVNGEITHFYGPEDKAAAGNTTNRNNVGHEYWLRGMTSTKADTAFFARPALEGGVLFDQISALAADADVVGGLEPYTTKIYWRDKQHYPYAGYDWAATGDGYSGAATANSDYTAKSAETSGYNYANAYFTTYANAPENNELGYNSSASIYLVDTDQDGVYEDAQLRPFADYAFLDDHVPYIVSFPGRTYKEFDLSGEYNAWLVSTGSGGGHGTESADQTDHEYTALQTYPQAVSFGYVVGYDVTGTGQYEVLTTRTTAYEDYNHTSKVNNSAAVCDVDGMPIIEKTPTFAAPLMVPVTDDMDYTTTAGGLTHHGTFLNLANSTDVTTLLGADAVLYGIETDADGKQFVNASGSQAGSAGAAAASNAPIYAFRTYMTANAGASPRRIVIGSALAAGSDPAADEAQQPETPEPAPGEAVGSARHIKVYTEGMTLYVEANYTTDLPVFLPDGRHLGTVHAVPGTVSMPLPMPGVYVTRVKKVMAK